MSNMMFDYFDPEEIRRRQMMAPPGVNNEPPDTSNVMQEDEGDQDPSMAALPPGSASSTASPMLERFRQVLQDQPRMEDYQPSKFRRFAAALSGFGAGYHDPAAGVRIASDINRQPYQAAQERWQRALTGAQGEMAIEEKQTAQDIARRRAASYDVSAQARMKAAQATEAWRLYQQQHQPWQPQTRDEAIQFEQSKHTPTGWHPQTMDEYMKVHPPANPMDLETLRHRDALELESQRAGHESSRQREHDARVDARTKSEKPSTPQAQDAAEQTAIQELLRVNPDYKSFVKGGDFVQGAHGPTGKRLPHRVITADELPKAGGGFLGLGGTSESQASLARDKYRQFLSDLDRHKRAILGRQGQPAWSIQQEDEE